MVTISKATARLTTASTPHNNSKKAVDKFSRNSASILLPVRTKWARSNYCPFIGQLFPTSFPIDGMLWRLYSAPSLSLANFNGIKRNCTDLLMVFSGDLQDITLSRSPCLVKNDLVCVHMAKEVLQNIEILHLGWQACVIGDIDEVCWQTERFNTHMVLDIIYNCWLFIMSKSKLQDLKEMMIDLTFLLALCTTTAYHSSALAKLS